MMRLRYPHAPLVIPAGAREVPALAKCSVCRAAVRTVGFRERGASAMFDKFDAFDCCPHHIRGLSTVKVAPIRATESDHPCGVLCLYAKGPSCECSCNGRNHGAGHKLRAE